VYTSGVHGKPSGANAQRIKAVVDRAGARLDEFDVVTRLEAGRVTTTLSGLEPSCRNTRLRSNCENFDQQATF
jgi:hypothetical protein